MPIHVFRHDLYGGLQVDVSRCAYTLGACWGNSRVVRAYDVKHTGNVTVAK